MSTETLTKSLRSRIIGASYWVFGGHVISQALRLVSSLIMTRLLVPEMFGVMALVFVLHMGLNLFSDIGLRVNIIQSEHGDDPVFLNTAWTVQIIRGGVIWLFGLGLALASHVTIVSQIWPPDSVYAEPILPYVIGVFMFTAVIKGFESTKLATANRSLSLGVVTRIELLSQVLGLASMVTWALIDRSIWALVVGAFITVAFRVVLSHVWIPGVKNKLLWDWDAFKDIFHFGKWIFLTSIFGFFAISADRILMGGLVETRILGIFVIARLLLSAPMDVCNKIIDVVLYPALSEIVREKNKDLKMFYYRVRLPIDVVTLIGAGFIFSAGTMIVQILYDDRYIAAGHMLEVLSIALIFLRYNVVNNLFVAMGKPHLLALVYLVQILALYTLLPVTFYWFGLDGALWIMGCYPVVSLPIIFYVLAKNSILNVLRELSCLPLLVLGYGLGLSATALFSSVAILD